VSLVSLIAVRRRVPHPRRAGQRAGPRWRGLVSDFRQGIGYLVSVRLLVILTAVQIVVNLCLAVEKLIFYYARDTLGLTPAAVSVVVAAGGAGGIVGALTATRLAAWIGQIRLVVAAIAAAGIAIAAMSATNSLVTLTAANLSYAWALTVASLVNRTQRQQIIPRALLGRVTRTVRLLFLAVDPLGVVIAGSLTAALGGNPRPVFLGAGVIVIATAGAGWLAGLRTHQRGQAGKASQRSPHTRRAWPRR